MIKEAEKQAEDRLAASVRIHLECWPRFRERFMGGIVQRLPYVSQDQLAKDADKIESLLSQASESKLERRHQEAASSMLQMSEKMVPKPSAASHLVGHSSHSWILSSANLL